MQNEKNVNWKTIVIIGGAICAYLIGAGTATGQEAMQFYVAHGYLGIIAPIISFVVLVWSASAVIRAGYDVKDSNQDENVYKHFFGKFVGPVFEWFVVLFLFAVVVTVISGAGSIFSEFFQINKILGVGLMSGLIFITVILNLNKVTDIIGMIGPVIIIFAIIVSALSLMNNFDGLKNAGQLISSIEVGSASSSWLFSGILYASFGLTVGAPYFYKLGQEGRASKNRKEGPLGVLVGIGMFVLASLTMVLAMLADIKSVFDKGTPLVFLANNIFPFLGIVFAVIILAGIYSTGAPMLWYVCDKLAQVGSKRHKIISLALTIFAFIGALFLPFETLVGIAYPITGYVGLLLFLAIGYKQIITISNRKVSQNENKTL